VGLDDFEHRLSAAQPELRQWGKYVSELIEEIASSRNIKLQMLSSRVKEVESAVGKLSRKKYRDPMLEMTDLVGVRAVCLLSPDVETLCLALESYAGLDIRKSRDTSKEYEGAPDKFGYQSHHYEIRAKVDTLIDGVKVSSNTCCELQLRTLMQHAYAEVVHDSIYKSSWSAPTRAVRFVSSSAALIETADHLFCETMNILDLEMQDRGQLLEQLTALYDSQTHNSKFKDQKFNMMVLDQLTPIIEDDTADEVARFLSERSYIGERIVSRIDSDAFWSQPVSVLTYFLAHTQPSALKELWPFAESEDALEKIYSDLGRKYHCE
jgi:ppGpp synthetase/RelA/SpoT-type nucleotidyltranferase